MTLCIPWEVWTRGAWAGECIAKDTRWPLIDSDLVNVLTACPVFFFVCVCVYVLNNAQGNYQRRVEGLSTGVPTGKTGKVIIICFLLLSKGSQYALVGVGTKSGLTQAIPWDCANQAATSGVLQRLSTVDGYCHQIDSDGGHIAKVMMYKIGREKRQ